MNAKSNYKRKSSIKLNDTYWGIIPARGNSKSIPLKNLVRLGKEPLINYCIQAAKKSKKLSRIICSTDNKKIENFCHKQGIEVHKRPSRLAQDNSPIADVLLHLLNDIYEHEGILPTGFALLQPTSPFLLADHIDACIKLLRKDKKAASAQTISKFPHNFHAYNQRTIKRGYIHFKFPAQRLKYHNKQLKPSLYVFGNLVVTKTKAFLRQKSVFASPSIPHLIDRFFSLDVDTAEDVKLAEWQRSNYHRELKTA